MKSAKRISSLFSLGSKDHHSSQQQKQQKQQKQQQPPHLARPPPEQAPAEQSPGIQPRHVSSPAFRTSPIDPTRTGSVTPGSIDQFDLDSPLPPPPSLLEVNQDLANSTPGSPDSRPRSRSRAQSGSRPSSPGGLSVRDQSRPGTPTSHRRKSWMPGWPRPGSVDVKPASPTLSAGAPAAWIAGLEQKVVYDLDLLSRGEQVCELCTPAGLAWAGRIEPEGKCN